jgi:outer membrane receptor protein involved in Fe transport
VEFNGLRLDQTNVELPGQAFDIDFLCTDGYELTYVVEDLACCDQLDVGVWYNRTRFEGSAQRAGKRRQFPFYDFISFVGQTDVDSMSTGFRLASAWGCMECEWLTVGIDLRYLKQKLNEITSGRIALNIWNDANSPVPGSFFANPGLFFEYGAPVGNRWDVAAGGRVDLASADIVDDPAKLTSLGTESLPLAAILGTSDFTRTDALLAGYITGEYAINDCWAAQGALGYAERSPTLTELYAAETFMFVLQNGLNTVTGDPRLKRERLLQIDFGLTYDDGWFRGGITGFHGWAFDYITFENTGIIHGPPAGQVEQVQLKYVNTDLATFVGGELHGEFDISDWLTPFGTLSYVDGRDRSRNGGFATRPASPGNPSTRVPGLPRGSFSGVTGAAQEPLPSIVPLECRLGVRVHQPSELPRWGAELSARIVDGQDRVATSLLEVPTPGFTVWDLRAYWRATDCFLMVAGVENLGDKNYRNHLDFRSPNGIQVFQPGVNFYVGTELTY